MCLGDHETGGPSRCSGEALASCQTAIAHAERQQHSVAVLERQDEILTLQMMEVEDLTAALSGTLSPEREAVLLERAEKFRQAQAQREAEAALTAATVAEEPDWATQAANADTDADDCRARWQEAVDAREQSWETEPRSDADFEADCRDDYEKRCALTGEESTTEGLAEEIAAERAAQSSWEEYQSDICAGVYLADANARAVASHRGLAETLDPDQLDAVLAERQASPELADMTARRDQARAELDDATEQWAAAKAAFDNRESASLRQYDAARERLHNAFVDYKLVDADLEHHKNVTAQYAGVLGEKDPRPAYTGNMLGAARMIGEYEEGSRQWLEARQSGFGGSDAAKLLAGRYSSDKSDVVNGKINPISDEDAAEQLAGMRTYVGAAPRGHAWEPVLARQFAAENPDLDLRHTKASWKGGEEWQNLNIDGVIVDADDQPAAIWEAKTSNNKADWDNGIPAGYRAQLGQAMDVTGLDRSALTVAFDDGETRTYWMGRHDPIDPTGQDGRSYGDRKHELAEHWDKVKSGRVTANDPPAPPKKNNGQFRFIKEPGSDSSHKTNEDTARQLAVYRGCSTAEAENLIRDNLDQGMKADAAVRHAYRSYKHTAGNGRRYVIVDFETNGTHAGKHQIIQTGYQVVDADGTIHEDANSRHDINPRIAPTVGTGMIDVHQIDYQQLSGARPFDRSRERDRLTQLAADPNVTFVAHNANFELSYLRAHGIHTDRVIDTMNLSRKFDHESTGAKLSDFTRAHGVAYENAHDAYQDVDMTRRALINFFRGR